MHQPRNVLGSIADKCLIGQKWKKAIRGDSVKEQLPVDVYFPTIREKPETPTCVSNYVSSLKGLLRKAINLARSQTEAEAVHQKRYYDRWANAPILEPGDLVLLRLSGYKGKRKVIDCWESQPWTVVHQLPNGIPAYKVMTPGCERRVLHRNCPFLLKTADSPVPIVAAYASIGSNKPTNHSDKDSSIEELQEASEEWNDDSGILGFIRMARVDFRGPKKSPAMGAKSGTRLN